MPRKPFHIVSPPSGSKHSFCGYSIPLVNAASSGSGLPGIFCPGGLPAPVCIKGFNNIWFPGKENRSLQKFNIAQTISNHKVGIKFVTFSVRKPAVGVYYLHRPEIDLNRNSGTEKRRKRIVRPGIGGVSFKFY